MVRRLWGSCLGLWFWMALAATALAAPGWGVLEQAGVRWLRTPGGQPFYSAGVDIVHGCPYGKPGLGRHGLPDDPYGYCWPKFHDTEYAWRRHVERLLKDWGFNTRGGWSDTSRDMDLPYVVELDLGRLAQLHWFDPFDPEAAARTNALARELTAPYRDDPLCLGYFSDNEVGWWSQQVFAWYLKAGWYNHTKRELWRFLYRTYDGHWSRLRADFTPTGAVDSFADLKLAGVKLLLTPGGRGMAVVNRFCALVAGRTYALVGQALRQAHPGALVCGDRLPLYYDQDAVLAMGQSLDVVSTNYNVDVEDGWVAPYYFEGLERLTGKPVLISEYFFAARENRCGNANNGHLMTVDTQAQRTAGASAATAAFARFPNVVGAHWFHLYDEPTGGRYDGEDFNFGLLDCRGQPYEDLVAALRQVNLALPCLHGQAVWQTPPPVGSPYPLRALAQAPDLADGRLTDWADKAGTRLLGLCAPAPYVPFGDVHLGWTPAGLYLFCLAQNSLDPEMLAYQGQFPLAEAFQLHLRLAGHGRDDHLAVALLPVRSTRHFDMGVGRWEIEARIFRLQPDGTTEAVAGAMAQVINKPLPHIAFEIFVPAAALGLSRLEPGQTFQANVWAQEFFRARTMGWTPAGLDPTISLRPLVLQPQPPTGTP